MKQKPLKAPKGAETLHASLIEVARLEIKAWHNLSPGLVMIILFSFIHRFVTGKTLEQSFFRPKEQTEIDYQI